MYGVYAAFILTDGVADKVWSSGLAGFTRASVIDSHYTKFILSSFRKVADLGRGIFGTD